MRCFRTIVRITCWLPVGYLEATAASEQLLAFPAGFLGGSRLFNAILRTIVRVSRWLFTATAASEQLFGFTQKNLKRILFNTEQFI